MTIQSDYSSSTILFATVLPWLIIVFLITFLTARRGKIPRDLRRAQVLVLGDIGRSPRMQYHALSLAKHGKTVDLVGYHESPLHSDIVNSPSINVISLPPPPIWLNTKNKSLFLVFGPLKALFQTISLFFVLRFKTSHAGWLLVQNPPSVPTLFVAQLTCFLRNTRFVIDWHNFGHSILALKLGRKHPLVHVSRIYETIVSQGAYVHLCVTDAMAKSLRSLIGLSRPIVTLHDRPAPIFQVVSRSSQIKFLEKTLRLLDIDSALFSSILAGASKLVISSTSWTPDEDFSTLLDALKAYSSSDGKKNQRPSLLVVITGKGPLKAEFESSVRQAEERGLLSKVKIKTTYFDDIADYAKLLGSADLGISLHTSSSGVDLPMKVVDMFGAGLPVVGWSEYQAWPELVKEGVNGLGFRDAKGLLQCLEQVFALDPAILAELRAGAVKEGERRWDDEWNLQAGYYVMGVAPHALHDKGA